MDISQEEFIKKLRETFNAEAKEHVEIITTGLLKLEQQKEKEADSSLIEEVFRAAHSLKGAARAVNHTIIQNICQSLENVLSALRQNQIHLSSSAYDILYKTIEIIKNYLTVEGTIKDQKECEQLDLLSQQLQTISEGNEISPAAKKIELNSSSELPLETSSTVRVSIDKLDMLLQQIEEMLMFKITSRQRAQDVNSLMKALEKFQQNQKKVLREIQSFDHGMTNSANFLADHFYWQEEQLKEIQDKLSQLKKESNHDSRLSGTIVDNLLDDAKKILMQPCQTLFTSFPLMVREISNQLGKEIDLIVEGEEIEIDRRILDELKDPLLHLIRNSIDHGIELPEERINAHKPEKGTIKITVSQHSGSSVDITLYDDGRGVDMEKLKQSAINNQIISEKELEELLEEDILKLMFYSGVSTSKMITDLSGRGVGMNVVSEKVEKLGGQIFIKSKHHLGTQFTIRLPITLATFRGIHVVVDQQSFIIPTHFLQRVLRLPKELIYTVEGKETILYHNRNISYVNLSDILGLPKSSIKQEFLYIIVIRASEVTVAIGIDAILNEQEVFIKNLGKQLTKVEHLSAATVMEWGKVTPILDPFDLVKTIIQGKTTPSSTFTAHKKQKSKKTILVAEDTVTARMLLKNILDASGYDVKTAVDGLEAYSILMENKIDLLLSDIEMPKMSGFELASKVRKTENLKEIPIILCSSLSSKEDKEKGVAAGANAYIIKSNFEQSNLLETIERLT